MVLGPEVFIYPLVYTRWLLAGRGPFFLIISIFPRVVRPPFPTLPARRVLYASGASTQKQLLNSTVAARPHEGLAELRLRECVCVVL